MKCNDNTCAPGATTSPLMVDDHCPTKKYSKEDACMLHSSGMIVKSLTTEPNGTDPLEGAMATPPTWKAKSLCELLLG